MLAGVHRHTHDQDGLLSMLGTSRGLSSGDPDRKNSVCAARTSTQKWQLLTLKLGNGLLRGDSNILE